MGRQSESGKVGRQSGKTKRENKVGRQREQMERKNLKTKGEDKVKKKEKTRWEVKVSQHKDCFIFQQIALKMFQIVTSEIVV